MNLFERWWHEIGSALKPKNNDDYEQHAKKVCSKFYSDLCDGENDVLHNVSSCDFTEQEQRQIDDEFDLLISEGGYSF